MEPVAARPSWSLHPKSIGRTRQQCLRHHLGRPLAALARACRAFVIASHTADARAIVELAAAPIHIRWSWLRFVQLRKRRIPHQLLLRPVQRGAVGRDFAFLPPDLHHVSILLCAPRSRWTCQRATLWCKECIGHFPSACALFLHARHDLSRVSSVPLQLLLVPLFQLPARAKYLRARCRMQPSARWQCRRLLCERPLGPRVHVSRACKNNSFARWAATFLVSVIYGVSFLDRGMLLEAPDAVEQPLHAGDFQPAGVTFSFSISAVEPRRAPLLHWRA